MQRKGTRSIFAGVSRRALLAGGLAMSAWISLPGRARARSPVLLEARRGTAQLLPAGEAKTAIWGYDGRVPGPELRLRKGDRLTARMLNRLSQPTTIHWHGIRIDNRMDGVPGLTQAPVPPDEGFLYDFTLPDAGTYWYHSHDKSWEQVAQGLYGVLIVEEDEPPLVDREVVVVIDDWRLDDDGQIDTASFGAMHDWSHAGRLGNVVTLNGLDRLDLSVRSGERLRVRLVNAANARVMSLRFDGQEAFLIALDGQAIGKAVGLGGDAVELAPAQRADLILDLAGGPGTRSTIVLGSGGQEVEVGTLIFSEGEPLRSSPLDAPMAAAQNTLPAPDLENALLVPLPFEGGAMGGMREARHGGRMMDIRTLVEKGLVWALAGEAGRPAEPLFRVERGRTVLIEMENRTAFPHAMHWHGHHARELRRDGDAIALGPWRDTELVQPDEKRTVALVADNPGKWLLHCHMLEHHAGGMGTWFEVL